MGGDSAGRLRHLAHSISGITLLAFCFLRIVFTLLISPVLSEIYHSQTMPRVAQATRLFVHEIRSSRPKSSCIQNILAINISRQYKFSHSRLKLLVFPKCNTAVIACSNQQIVRLTDSRPSSPIFQCPILAQFYHPNR